MRAPPPRVCPLAPTHAARPPAPLTPLLITTSPLTPDTELPLPTHTDPVVPTLPVPLLNTSDPLTPDVIAFADRMRTAPDDDTDPAPLTTLTTPPTLDDDVVDPPNTYTSPPAPLFVLPTTTDTDPADPDVADPLPTTTYPTLPCDVDPLLITISPLSPTNPYDPSPTITDPLDPPAALPLLTPSPHRARAIGDEKNHPPLHSTLAHIRKPGGGRKPMAVTFHPGHSGRTPLGRARLLPSPTSLPSLCGSAGASPSRLGCYAEIMIAAHPSPHRGRAVGGNGAHTALARHARPYSRPPRRANVSRWP